MTNGTAYIYIIFN